MKLRAKIGDLIEHLTQAALTVDHKLKDQPEGKVYLRAKVVKTEDAEKHFMYLYSINSYSRTFIRIPAESVIEEGDTLVDPGKLLGGLLGRAPDTIAEISADGEKKRTRVKVGKDVFHLPYLNSVESFFNGVKALPRAPILGKINSNTLLEFIRRSAFCIPSGSNGQQQFALDVLCFRGLTDQFSVSATDGHAIAVNSCKATNDAEIKDILIVQNSLLPLQKLLQKHKDAEVKIIGGNRTKTDKLQEVFFEMSGVLFGSKLNSSIFPNIEVVLKQQQSTFQAGVDREALKNSLLRASSFVGANRYLKLTMDSADGLKVSASDIQTENVQTDMDDELEIVELKGEFTPISMLCNLDYLTNIVALIPKDVVFLGFNPDKTKAMVVQDESDQALSTQYAIMPIQQPKPAKKEKKKAETDA
jgi:DNA polymerase III sliding clamp (beta) subunit (PCNA family)